MAGLCWKLALVIVLMSVVSLVQGRNVGTLEWESSKGYLLYCPCSGRFTGQVEQLMGALQFSKALGRILVAPSFINYPCGRKDSHSHFGVQAPVHMDHNVRTTNTGRFGNQLEQFMGSLFFASKTGRVLVIPPFIMYPNALETSPRNAYVQVDEYFEMDEIKKYYPDVITMDDFMADLAPLHWKAGNRMAYCASGLADNNEGKCTREGNPFRTFWEDQGIEFDGSEVWRNLHFNVEQGDIARQWKAEYPASTHPVIALVTAPTLSPITHTVEGLQHFLKFKSIITDDANEFIETKLVRPFWGLHLRNGADWSRTCELLSSGDYPHLLSSRQCTSRQGDAVTREMCLQSEEQVITDIRYQLELAEEEQRELPKSIFVATDHVAMEEDLQAAFPDIKIVTWGPKLDQMDLYVLNQADDVILNCVSAFSAYVKRDRDVNEQLVAFFGYLGPEKVLPKVTRSPPHEEL